MIYLQPSEYEQYGLEATTPAAWVTAASTMIEAHCRRATLGIAQYSERVRVSNGRNVVRLTYLPLAAMTPSTSAIVAVRGRYTMPRRGELAYSEFSSDYAAAFGLPGTWADLDVSLTEYCAESGEVTVPLRVSVPVSTWLVRI